MKPPYTVVIPARNEELTVKSVINAVCKHPMVARVIVVDNGSIDDTYRVASNAGATVFREPVHGLGRAIKRGIEAADTNYILKTDADILNFNPAWLDLLCNTDQDCLHRGIFTSPYDEFPVTRLVVKPLLEIFAPALALLQTPISGTYSFRTDSINWRCLPNDWSWDIALLIQAYERKIFISDADLGVLEDKQRDLSHYEPMARDIHNYFLKKYTARGVYHEV
jgi:glycosyltransferase involved in cell wall biosynthesis